MIGAKNKAATILIIISSFAFVFLVWQGSTMQPKHSHLQVTFVKCESKFCINSQTASWYFQNIFVPSPILFFNLNSDVDYPVF